MVGRRGLLPPANASASDGNLKAWREAKTYARAMPSNRHKPRELRRRVMLPARMRTAAGWSDACILNVSSRGMLIHAGRPSVQGSLIELRHQQHVIVARVVWREGSKAGLRAEDRVPIEQILALGSSPGLQLTAGSYKGPERRCRPRTHEQSRHQSRLFEFAGLVAVAIAAAWMAVSLVSAALARPLAAVQTALTG